MLRPFVYRRYLDFGVFESLREMKELIAREVERRELEDNIKLGPGGIREIEFIVQAFQLIRGGSDPRLQTRSLRDALRCSRARSCCPPTAVEELERCVSLSASRREPAAGVERRADARAAGRRARGGCGSPRDGCRGLGGVRGRAAGTPGSRRAHFRTLVFGPTRAGAGNGAARELERILEPELDARA